MLTFEGVVGYSASDPEEAAHFFEHTLGLESQGDEAGLRFYAVGGGLTLTVDTSGASAGDPPYLLFSTDDLVEAAEHFLNRGCAMKPLTWAPEGGGFVARSPEGYSVAVVDRSLLTESEVERD
jgi:predicted enzyme related to lactoylglutathione lyase